MSQGAVLQRCDSQDSIKSISVQCAMPQVLTTKTALLFPEQVTREGSRLRGRFRSTKRALRSVSPRSKAAAVLIETVKRSPAQRFLHGTMTPQLVPCDQGRNSVLKYHKHSSAFSGDDEWLYTKKVKHYFTYRRHQPPVTRDSARSILSGLEGKKPATLPLLSQKRKST